jgi:hypothetical protein
VRAKAILFTTTSPAPTVEELTAPLKLDRLQTIIGGYVELVPHFDSVSIDGVDTTGLQKVVAFCDEDGKLKQYPINHRATLLWHEALKRKPERFPNGLMDKAGRWADSLCGPILIFACDDEFFSQL